MIPRISISNYADATEIYEALAQAHRDIEIQSSTAFLESDISIYKNRAEHLEALMTLVADEVVRIGNEEHRIGGELDAADKAVFDDDQLDEYLSEQRAARLGLI